jgi:FkbM family methyltransferase
MASMSVSRRRQIGLVLAGLIVVAGDIWGYRDAFTFSALILAVALIWSSREWKAWLIAAMMVAAGLFWSSLDARCCSAWWRGRVVYEKLAGHFSYVGWSNIMREVSSSCFTGGDASQKVDKSIKRLETNVVQGRKRELFQTELGNFWLPAPGKPLISFLIWEMTVQKDYESDGVGVDPGDVVIDCGAHVGVFTKYALRHGAAMVVAIEPDPTNLACLEDNLAAEISDGRVKVVKAGVWDHETTLTLFQVENGNSGMDGFLGMPQETSKIPGIPVHPLDDIVRDLDLDRVDFIKMDIEGSEVRALEGARETLARFRPRMAICTYHKHEDVNTVPQVVMAAQPHYQIHAKDIEPRGGSQGIELRTKVLFFR